MSTAPEMKVRKILDTTSLRKETRSGEEEAHLGAEWAHSLPGQGCNPCGRGESQSEATSGGYVSGQMDATGCVVSEAQKPTVKRGLVTDILIATAQSLIAKSD